MKALECLVKAIQGLIMAPEGLAKALKSIIKALKFRHKANSKCVRIHVRACVFWLKSSSANSQGCGEELQVSAG